MLVQFRLVAGCAAGPGIVLHELLRIAEPAGQPAHGTQSLTVLVTPREGDTTGVGTLSDAASKPAYLAGAGWREQTRRFGIDHALRVDEDGDVEVTKALRARLQFIGDIKPVIVD